MNNDPIVLEHGCFCDGAPYTSLRLADLYAAPSSAVCFGPLSNLHLHSSYQSFEPGFLYYLRQSQDLLRCCWEWEACSEAELGSMGQRGSASLNRRLAVQGACRAFRSSFQGKYMLWSFSECPSTHLARCCENACTQGMGHSADIGLSQRVSVNP